MQSFSTFYRSQVENHADLNAEYAPRRRGAMPQGLRHDPTYVCRLASAQPPAAQSRHHKHAFAAALLIEHPVGVLGLPQPPAVDEQALDPNFSVGNEACACSLSDL